MKILHLGKYFPPASGGIEAHVQTLARGQSDLGNEVSVLCVNHADENGEDVISFNSKRTPFKSDEDQSVRVTRVGRIFSFKRFDLCPSLLGILREKVQAVDIVHLHAPNPLMVIAWVFAANRRKPLVITHHSDTVKQKFLRYGIWPFERIVYQQSKLILATSACYKENSVQLKGYYNKVFDLPMGIDINPFSKPNEQIKSLSNKFKSKYGSAFWLMVGRLTYYKGYVVALEALTRVRGNLVIIGKGSLETELKSKAKELGVDNRVYWVSSVNNDELVAFYHGARALWFPSTARSEGFGLVQVEAMASGCPVINTDIPGSGVAWVSQNGLTGLTVAVNDSESFANAAFKLLTDDKLHAFLAKNAIKRAHEEFDSQVMAKRSLYYYNKVL